jgi:hypothetical protein
MSHDALRSAAYAQRTAYTACWDGLQQTIPTVKHTCHVLARKSPAYSTLIPLCWKQPSQYKPSDSSYASRCTVTTAYAAQKQLDKQHVLVAGVQPWQLAG